ncbi:S-formylglutathione hydrolase [Aphelenchoides fujianensis]|nr:S-formylglutathione hydrolase [Aphelenchoides fujianensis]
MKTRAAVAFEAKKPLEIVEVDLEGPKAGEVMIEIKATGFGMTHFVNPTKVEGDLVAHLVALTDGGADYTFDATGNTDVTMTVETLSTHRVHGGTLRYCKHASTSTGTPMKFTVWTPDGQGPFPYLVWLSGLTCTEDNFTVKSGVYEHAAKHGIAIVAPDTSPRGEGVADDPAYDLGQGAGFYHPELFKSVSAFAPIVSPLNCPWGDKALTAYLGPDRAAWRPYDACALIEDGKGGGFDDILIDQGLADNFLESQLKPELIEAAAAKAGRKVTVRTSACVIIDADEGHHDVTAVRVERDDLVIRVSSNGCTRSDDFSVESQRRDGLTAFTFTRKRPDMCRALIAEGVELRYPLETFGVERGGQIRVRNPLVRP